MMKGCLESGEAWTHDTELFKITVAVYESDVDNP